MWGQFGVLLGCSWGSHSLLWLLLPLQSRAGIAMSVCVQWGWSLHIDFQRWFSDLSTQCFPPLPLHSAQLHEEPLQCEREVVWLSPGKYPITKYVVVEAIVMLKVVHFFFFFSSYFKNNDALHLASFKPLLDAHICHWLIDFSSCAITAELGRSQSWIPCLFVAWKQRQQQQRFGFLKWFEVFPSWPATKKCFISKSWGSACGLGRKQSGVPCGCALPTWQHSEHLSSCIHLWIRSQRGVGMWAPAWPGEQQSCVASPKECSAGGWK